MIKFIFIFLGHLSIFLFICLPLMIIGAIVLLPICPFIPKEQLRLPSLLKWFDIVDSYVNRDTSAIQKIYAQGWWARYCYIAWRNPINYFDYMYCGLKWKGTETYTLYNPAQDNINTGGIPGFRHIEVTQLYIDWWGHKCFRYYYEYAIVYVYPFAKSYCFYMRLGWKIVNKNNPYNSISQWCLTINPVHPFTGKAS